MENIISSLLNIKELMEDTLQRFDVVQQHLDDFRASHDKMHQIFQLSLDELEDRICEIQEEDAVVVEEDKAKGEIKPAQLTISDVLKNPEPFPSFSDLSLRTLCPLHFRNYFFPSFFLSVAISNNYSPLSDSLFECIFEQSYLSQIPFLQTKHSIEVDDKQILSYRRFKAKAKMGINEEFLDDKVKRMRDLFSRFSFDATPSSSKRPTLEEMKSSFRVLNEENGCIGADLVRWIVGSSTTAATPSFKLRWNFDPGGVTTICLFTSSQLRKNSHSAETIIPTRSLYSIQKSSSNSILFETRSASATPTFASPQFRTKPSEKAPFSNDDSKSFDLEHGTYSHLRLVIFDYNGIALIVVVGKNYFAIASDCRLEVQLQTISTDFQRIYKINDHLFLGLSGLATNAQTLYQRLVFRHKQYQRRKGRNLKLENVASMLSTLLDEKRFGPYFFQLVIAGLGDENKPILLFFSESSLDFDYVVLLGCVAMEDSPQTLRGLYGTVVAFVLHMKKVVWVPQVFVKMPSRSVEGLIFNYLLLGVWCFQNLALQEKLGEIIDELVKCGLIERFPLVSFIKLPLKNSKKNTSTILKNSNNSMAATEESRTLELSSIRATIKCVEDKLQNGVMICLTQGLEDLGRTMSCFGCLGENNMPRAVSTKQFLGNNSIGINHSYLTKESMPKNTWPVTIQPIAVSAIPLKELKDITDNFGTKALIGESLDGKVYHNVLASEQATAIKKLDSSKQPAREFLAQVPKAKREPKPFCVDFTSIKGKLSCTSFKLNVLGEMHQETIESEEQVFQMARHIKPIASKLGLPLVFKSNFDKANGTMGLGYATTPIDGVIIVKHAVTVGVKKILVFDPGGGTIVTAPCGQGASMEDGLSQSRNSIHGPWASLGPITCYFPLCYVRKWAIE